MPSTPAIMPPRPPATLSPQTKSPLALLQRYTFSSSPHPTPPFLPPLALTQQHHGHHYHRPRQKHNHNPFSTLSRPPPSYPDHIPLSPFERTFLGLSSTLLSFLNPSRGDLIALCSETTTPLSLVRRLRDHMLSSPSGRAILRDRPRMTSATLPSPEKLREMPAGSLGRAYAEWLAQEGVSPDTRAPVRHIPDAELAYILQRYRESHDFIHVLCGALPTVREGEIAVKAFEFAALGIPMTGLAVGSVVTLKHREEWDRFWRVLGPWAVRSGGKAGAEVLCVRWEEELENDLERLRARLGIEPLPVRISDGGGLRGVRKREREERKAKKAREREREKENGAVLV